MMTELKDRVRAIMKQQGMRQQDMATVLQVSTGKMSNILNGKTNISVEQTTALHSQFPNLNMHWLLYGEGDMFSDITDGQPVSIPVQSLFPNLNDPSRSASNENPASSASIQKPEQTRISVNFHDKSSRRGVKEITVFYDDGTYESFAPVRRA